jgi:hypothetical protein
VHGFSCEFRNIQCLHYSATPISCSPIHHQISLIFPHPNNTTITHSFPQSTITCYFLHSSPGACGIKAHAPWRQCKTHGQYSKNNSFDDRSLPFHMEHKSHATDDSESHNAGQLFIGYYQEHQAQNSYFYIFLDIFSFPLTTSDDYLDTLPRSWNRSQYDSDSWP